MQWGTQFYRAVCANRGIGSLLNLLWSSWETGGQASHLVDHEQSRGGSHPAGAANAADCWGTVRYPVSGAPSLQDLMPDDLRWSSCNNNRHKVNNQHTVLESSPNRPTTTLSIRGKTVFHNTCPWCLKGWGLLLYVHLNTLEYLY